MLQDSSLAAADVLASVSALSDKVFAPNAATIDAEGRYPCENLQGLRGAGLLLLPVAREYGGLATRQTDTSDVRLCNRVFREIARACSSTAQVYFVHCMVVRRLLRSGTPAQREFIVDAVRGGAAFAAATQEPAGKTILNHRATVRRVPGGFLLNCTKTFCTGHGGARYLSVNRVREEGQEPRAGSGAPPDFVCLVAMDQPGVTPHHDWDNLGQRGTTSGSIRFTDVFVPDEMTWPTSFQSSYYGLILQTAFAAIVLGIGEGALAAAAEYVRTNTRPYPMTGVERAVDDANVQWHMGDLATRLHLAALAVDHASDVDVMEAAEAESGAWTRADASLAIAKAKIATTTAAVEVCNRMFQVMGARSTARKLRLDRYWRDIRTLSLHDPVDQKYRLVGRNVLTGDEPPVSTHT